MRIPEVRDFHAGRAGRELLRQGYTAVGDIGELLYKHAEAELFEALGHQADYLDIVTDRVDTDFGPVSVFRDAARVSLESIAAPMRKARGIGG